MGRLNRYFRFMDSLSDTLSQTVETLGHSLVSVHGRRGYPLSGAVWSDGVIVTTSRAVERGDDLYVGLPNGETLGAELIGRAPNVDLAALRLTSDVLKTPTWISADSLKVGQIMLRLGRPRGSVRATMGVLSGLEPWRSHSGVRLDQAVMTDADTFRGFSGGVLATLTGELVGVNTAALSRSGDSVVPTSNLEKTIRELLEYGRVRQGYLGISGQPVKLPEALQTELGQRAGLLVMSVEPGSPAERAGLSQGDVILSLNGVKVARSGGLVAELSGEHIGKTLPLTAARGGRVQTFELGVAERSR